MDASDTHTRPTRRAVLAACGTAMLSGCSDLLTRGSSGPPIDCSPTAPSWPMYGYDSAHTSHLAARDLPPATARSHRFSQTGTRPGGAGSTNSPPAIRDAVAYVAGGVRIEARDTETGTRLWETDPDDTLETSPVVACGVVYVSTVNETLALSQADGTVLWRADRGAHLDASSSPVAVDDTIYVAGTGIAALDAETGTERWHAQTDHTAHGVAASERVYVGAGSNGRRTLAFDVATGDRLWTFETGVSNGAPVITGDRMLVTGANTGIHVLDAETGDRQRHWKVGNVGSQPVIADGRLFYRGWNVSDVFVIE